VFDRQCKMFSPATGTVWMSALLRPCEAQRMSEASRYDYIWFTRSPDCAVVSNVITGSLDDPRISWNG
jgi:hypothetical protein